MTDLCGQFLRADLWLVGCENRSEMADSASNVGFGIRWRGTEAKEGKEGSDSSLFLCPEW